MKTILRWFAGLFLLTLGFWVGLQMPEEVRNTAMPVSAARIWQELVPDSAEPTSLPIPEPEAVLPPEDAEAGEMNDPEPEPVQEKEEPAEALPEEEASVEEIPAPEEEPVPSERHPKPPKPQPVAIWQPASAETE